MAGSSPDGIATKSTETFLPIPACLPKRRSRIRAGRFAIPLFAIARPRYPCAMKFIRLKNYMPRNLYGRAALILLLPVLAIQLVVSVMFIQRHYEDVTRQMTQNVLHELRYLLNADDSAGSRNDAMRNIAESLAIGVAFDGAVPRRDTRPIYDLSGRIVILTLREGLEGVTGIDLAGNDKEVLLGVATRTGPVEIRFPRRRVSASNPHQLLVLMVFTGLLMTGIAYLFLRNQLRPIKRLAAVSEAFGKGRAEPYRPSGAAEVRAAGQSFLKMRARIERQIEQRTLMLSGIGHDLRTPLTRFRLGLAMLPEDDAEPLRRDVGDMERMLNGFLDFARGDASDDMEAVRPVELAREAIDRAARAGGNVALSGVGGSNEPAVLRAAAVSRALDNLIENALRYGGKARVGVNVTGKSICYSVEDDGPGIPGNRREEALKPFTRLEPARNQNRGPGVGLGLSIAADIARGHGGGLHLGKSETLGGLKAELRLAQ